MGEGDGIEGNAFRQTFRHKSAYKKSAYGAQVKICVTIRTDTHQTFSENVTRADDDRKVIRTKKRRPLIRPGGRSLNLGHPREPYQENQCELCPKIAI